MITRSEIDFWNMISDDFGIEIISPFELTFPGDRKLELVALVKNFGDIHGMVIARDYDSIEPFEREIRESGYGFSTNIGGIPEKYNRGVMASVLKDWGWSGPERDKPSWLR